MLGLKSKTPETAPAPAKKGMFGSSRKSMKAHHGDDRSVSSSSRAKKGSKRFSSSRKVAANDASATKGSSKSLFSGSSKTYKPNYKTDSPATVDALLKQINEQNREAEERAVKAERRAEKAEERAEKAEERALKAEQRAQRVEAKLESLLDNFNSISKGNMFC